MPDLEKQIRDFHLNGYVVLPCPNDVQSFIEMQQLFNKVDNKATSLISQPLDQCDAQYGRYRLGDGARLKPIDDEGSVGVHLVNWLPAVDEKDAKQWLTLSRRPDHLAIARKLLNSEFAEHIICQAHFKHPQGPSVKFPAHRDETARQRYGYNNDAVEESGGIGYVALITAVENHTKKNGAIWVCKGSHRLSSPETKRQFIELQAGQTLVMHPKLLHGSEKNTTDFRRGAVVNGFILPSANQGQYPGDGAGVRFSLKTGENVLSCPHAAVKPSVPSRAQLLLRQAGQAGSSSGSSKQDDDGSIAQRASCPSLSRASVLVKRKQTVEQSSSKKPRPLCGKWG